MPKIIISYRRAQNDAIAGRIRDRLVAHYGADAVFMDVDNIPFGTDFRKHIDAALTAGDVVVAVIGPKWIGPQKGKKARILDETDPVRVEIETAMRRGITVVPILVDGATMPKPAELPESIRDLAYANAASVDTGRDFHQHMDRVMRSMDGLVKAPPARAPPSPRRRRGMAAAILAALVVVGGGVLTFVPSVRDAILGVAPNPLPDIAFSVPPNEAPDPTAAPDAQPNPATMGEAPAAGPAMDTPPASAAEAPTTTPSNGDGGLPSDASRTVAPTDGNSHRVALVIANEAYEVVPMLRTPANDARVVADAFEKIGFDVTSKTNLDREGLVSALHEFSQHATGAAAAAFYYSGYGIQLNDVNYLVPVDATLLTDRDVPFEAVPFDRVQDALSGAKEPRIVIVDAARGNPFESRMTRGLGTRSMTQGLARVDPAEGDLIMFSAAPGTIAEDGDGQTSAFADALARRLTQPGKEIGFVIREIRGDVLKATDGRQEPFTFGAPGADEIVLADARPAVDAPTDAAPVEAAPANGGGLSGANAFVPATVGETFTLCGYPDFTLSIMPPSDGGTEPSVVVQRDGLANALGAKALKRSLPVEVVDGCDVTLMSTSEAPRPGAMLMQRMPSTLVR